MSEDSFKHLVASFILPFAKHGFRQVEEEYYAREFGNALATFAGEDFRFRLVRDRGQLFVEVAPLEDPDDWYDLRLVLKFLGETIDTDRLDEEGLRELQSKLEANYPKVVSLFTSFLSTKPKLQQFRTDQVMMRFAKLGLNLNP